MKLGIHRILRYGLVLTVVLSVSACGDYRVGLPGGYSLVSVYSGAALISNPEHVVVVDANIDAYTVVGNLIVGHVSMAELSPEKESSIPGYFIVNVETHHVTQGLGKDAWLGYLRQSGFNEPKLRKPSWLDRIRRWG